MKNESGKKSLFSLLGGDKKNKKSSCCSSFVIEEISEEKSNATDEKQIQKDKNNTHG